MVCKSSRTGGSAYNLGVTSPMNPKANFDVALWVEILCRRLQSIELTHDVLHPQKKMFKALYIPDEWPNPVVVCTKSISRAP